MKIVSLIKIIFIFIFLSQSALACIDSMLEELSHSLDVEETIEIIENAQMDLMFCPTPSDIKRLAVKSYEMINSTYYYRSLKMNHADLFYESYQIGSEWNREVVEASSLTKKQKENFKRFVSIDDASGFYFGNNIVITNEHVVRNKECSDLSLTLNTNKTALECRKILKVVKNLDLAIIEVKENEVLKQYQKAKIEKPKKGQPLITFGRGYLHNEDQQIKVESSNDCRVLLDHSETGEVLSKKSVAIGCDVSNGDSGSLVFDRENGNIVGLIWGNKNNHFSFSSEELRHMNNNEKYNELIKQESSYMVPIDLIMSYL